MSVNYTDKPNTVEVTEEDVSVTVVASIGAIGPQGIKGDKGDKGDTGDTGATGPQGPVGPEGGTSTLTTKGDLLGRTTSAVARVPIGTVDGHVLTVDTSSSTGLTYGAAVDATKIPLSLVDAKGDLVVGTATDLVTRLPVGSVNGQVLTVDSSTATGLAYASAVDATKIPLSLVDAKGDLVVGTANDLVTRLPVGTVNGHVLTVDSSTATGLAYGAAVDATKIPLSLVDAKGDLVVGTANDSVARLPVGTVNGHVLTVDSSTASGLAYAAAVDSTKIALSTIDAKGDLVVGTANDSVARLGVGANDTVLMARSGETTGLAWGAPRLAGGAARPLLTGGAYLSGSGLVLNALSGNYASSPDSAALSITGDIDIKVKVAMTDWTPSEQKILVAKWATNSVRSYFLRVNTDGTLALIWSTNGTNSGGAGSTVATGIADGVTKWVRATLDADNGAGNGTLKFYTSDDGTTWTQLGTNVAAGSVVTIFDSTSILEVGSLLAGTANLVDGTVYRAIIQSAYDTANNTDNLVYDANFETATADALAFTESSSNAATVTINTTRYTYGIPNTTLTSVSTLNVGANSERIAPFIVTSPIIIDMVSFEVTTAPVSTAIARFAIYAADSNYQGVGAPLVNESITVATSTTGIYSRQFTSVTLQPGAYLFFTNSDVTFTARSVQLVASYVRQAFGTSPFTGTISVARTSATYPTTPPVWNTFGGNSTGAPWSVFLRWKAA